jgi:NADPH2:quinone reductase
LIEHDRPLQISEVELRAPAADEVLVDLAFAGVNPVDGYISHGKVAVDGPLPRTLGGEASGTVDGTPVLVCGGGLGAARDGVWAGGAIVPRTAVVGLPEGVGLPEAAATGIAGLTAWNVVHLAEVGSGDRVLVLGASGGVGLVVVSFAASLGATVWGQTSSDAKASAIREQGADEVVVSDAHGLPGAVSGLRPTVVVDALGSDFTQAGLSTLDPSGRLVIFGASAGAEGTVNLLGVYRNGLRMIGYAGLRLTDDERRKGLEGALQAVKDGRMRIRIDRTMPLEGVNEALDLLSAREVAGKVLLELS